jgi:hypothetical protein
MLRRVVTCGPRAKSGEFLVISSETVIEGAEWVLRDRLGGVTANDKGRCLRSTLRLDTTFTARTVSVFVSVRKIMMKH